jgi:clan AA aspartic protease (TIGR02281 family)
MNIRRHAWPRCPELRALYLLASALFVSSALTPATVSLAALYRCIDQTGQSIFTDRIVQMTQCAPLSEESPSTSFPTPSSTLPSDVTDPSSATRLPPLESSPTALDHVISIPVQRIGQLYVVPVELNGSRTVQLILDTGASHTILSQEVVRDLALLPSDYRPGLVLLKTASGSVDARVVQIDSMKIATAEVRNSSAAVHTVPDFPAGVDGLLGLSFLHQFEITLDSSKGELRLKRVQP